MANETNRASSSPKSRRAGTRAGKAKIFPFLLLSGLLLLTGCASGSTSGTSTGNPAGTSAENPVQGTETPSTEDPGSAPTGSGEAESGPSDLPAEKPRRVILLAGQSNSVGHSLERFLPDKEGIVPAGRYRKMKNGYPNIKIFYSNNPYDKRFTAEKTEKFLPVTFGYGVKPFSGTTFGPEVGMAEALNEAFPGEEFYIIKCATGGAALYDRWNPGNATSESLYKELLSTTEDALGKLTADGGRAEIVAFLWMQGETDCRDFRGKYSADFREYIELFDRLVKGVEEKFGNYLPTDGLAVIQAGISTYWKDYSQLNAAKEKYVAERANTYYFSTDDLTYNKDNTDYSHYDAASEILLGNRFGECIVKRMEKESP